MLSKRSQHHKAVQPADAATRTTPDILLSIGKAVDHASMYVLAKVLTETDAAVREGLELDQSIPTVIEARLL